MMPNASSLGAEPLAWRLLPLAGAALLLLVAACSTEGADPSTSPGGSQPSHTEGPPSGSGSGGLPPEVPIGGPAPPPGSVFLPAIPRALTAYPGDEEIRVRWWPVEGAEGYALYRSTRQGGTPERAERIEVEAPFWLDTDAPDGSTRWYAVAAIVDDEEGPLSGEVRGLGVRAVQPLELRLTMAEQDLDRLFSRNPYSDIPLPAALKVRPGNLEVAVEGVRFRGAGSRRYPKFGFNIRLDERPDFNFGDRLRRGGNRILINAMWTDPSAMRDAIAYSMYHHVGLPAPRTYWAELYLNDIYEGFYVAFERIDRELLDGAGLNSTRGRHTLVRDQMKSNRLRLDMEEVRTMYSLDIDAMFDTDLERIAFMREIYDWRGEVEDQDWEALLDLIRWAWRSEPGPSFAREFDRRFHADELIDFIAIHAISQDTDSFDEDYWLYMDAEDGRWRWLPWDKNLVFGSSWYGDFLGSNDFFRYDFILLSTLNNRIVEHLLETPQLKARLDARIRWFLETTFTPEWMEERIREYLPHVAGSMDRVADAESFIRQPQQHHGEIGYLPHHLEQLVEFMDLRRRWAAFELDRQAGIRYGEFERAWLVDVTLPADERRCAADRAGRTVACLTPAERWTGTFGADVFEEASVDGVQRRWELRFSRDFRGTLTLFYWNAPGRNWLDQVEDEEEWAGDQWRLELVLAGEGDAQRLRSRVNPYVNRVEAQADIPGGVYTATLPFGP